MLRQLTAEFGYLQIACIDLARSHHPALWFITWDPTQTIATRPLAIQLNGTWYPAPTRLASQGARSQVCSRLGVWLLKSQPAYGWDLTKNICELYGTSGYIATDYTYSPYGLPSQSTNGAAAGSIVQPIQWSSEYHDTELGLVYYNYRHYNPLEGRWTQRDALSELDTSNVYSYAINRIFYPDYLGLIDIKKVALYMINNTEIFYNKGCSSMSINIDKESPIFMFGPVPVRFWGAFYISGEPCCDKEAKRQRYMLTFGVALEGYGQLGLKVGQKNQLRIQRMRYKGDKKYFLYNPQKPTPPTGVSEKGATFGKKSIPSCYKENWNWNVQVFARGSVGLIVGAYGSVNITLLGTEVDYDNLMDLVKLEGGTAWGIIGASMEIGIRAEGSYNKVIN